jgi:hypothetical protein
MTLLYPMKRFTAMLILCTAAWGALRTALANGAEKSAVLVWQPYCSACWVITDVAVRVRECTPKQNGWQVDSDQ